MSSSSYLFEQQIVAFAATAVLARAIIKASVSVLCPSAGARFPTSTVYVPVWTSPRIIRENWRQRSGGENHRAAQNESLEVFHLETSNCQFSV
jgi:hypothetical protein